MDTTHVYYLFCLSIASYEQSLGSAYQTLTSTKEVQEQLQPRIITAVRQPQLIPYELSSIANKESQLCDAGLLNGRRFRVGWAPNLCLLHTGDSKGNITETQRPKLKEKQILFGSRTSYGSACSDFSVAVENVCIGDGADSKPYLLVSSQRLNFCFLSL